MTPNPLFRMAPPPPEGEAELIAMICGMLTVALIAFIFVFM